MKILITLIAVWLGLLSAVAQNDSVTVRRATGSVVNSNEIIRFPRSLSVTGRVIRPVITLPASLHFNGAWQNQRTNALSGTLNVILTNISEFVTYKLSFHSTGTTATDLVVNFPGHASDPALTNGWTEYLIERVGTQTNITRIIPEATLVAGSGVTITDGPQNTKTIASSATSVGSTNSTPATAGNIGEIIEAAVTNANTAATGTYYDVVSVTLTPGHWFLNSIYSLERNGATFTGVDVISGISSSLAIGYNTAYDNASTLTSFEFLSLSIPSVPVYTPTNRVVALRGYVGSYSAGTPRNSARLTAFRYR